MTLTGATVFETALGWCGLVWTDAGVAGAHLPAPDEAEARSHLSRRFGAPWADPPPMVMGAVHGVTGLFAGRGGDLMEVVLDFSRASEFHKAIYALARAIPPGETRTYGELAAAAGEPGAAREVGQAMGKNPCPIIVPCHRVLAAGGKIGGFSAPGGIMTKRRLLAFEAETYAPAPLFAPRR